MQPFIKATPLGSSSLVLIDDLDALLLHDVVDTFIEKRVGFEGGLHITDLWFVFGTEELVGVGESVRLPGGFVILFFQLFLLLRPIVIKESFEQTRLFTVVLQKRSKALSFGSNRAGFAVILSQRLRIFSIERLPVKFVLNVLHAELAEPGRTGFPVHEVVDAGLQVFDDVVEAVILFGSGFTGPGNDKRGARLVQQHFVHFVDQGVERLSLHLVLGALGRAISKIVETDGSVGGVSNVTSITGPFLFRSHSFQHRAHGHPQKLEGRCHLFRVALGQSVVHSHQVRAFTGKGVEVERHHRGQGLSFAGHHFCNFVGTQSQTTQHLAVVRLHFGGDLGRPGS